MFEIRMLVCLSVLGLSFAGAGYGIASANAQNITWHKVERFDNPQPTWWDMDCSDSLHCMIVGWQGLGIESDVLATEDGGQSWKKVYVDVGGSPNRPFPLLYSGVSYPVPDRAIVTADSGVILRTTDGGESWEERRIVQTERALSAGSISMCDALHGVIVWKWPRFAAANGAEFLMTTDDGGDSWAEVPTSPFPEGWDTVAQISTVTCTGPDRYVCVLTDDGPRFDIASTTDGGQTWRHAGNPVPGESSVQFVHFDFVDPLNGYLGAIDFSSNWASVFARTTDGGASWELLHHGEIDGKLGGMYSISFRDRQTGLAGGPGAVFRTTDGGHSWSRDSLESVVPSTPYRVFVEWLGERGGVAAGSQGETFVWDSSISSVVDVPRIPEAGLTLYPNPALRGETVVTRLSLPAEGTLRFSLYDVTGRLQYAAQPVLLAAGRYETAIETSDLAPGTYLLRATTDGWIRERKLIVR